jgi:hypothetical protein
VTGDVEINAAPFGVRQRVVVEIVDQDVPRTDRSAMDMEPAPVRPPRAVARSAIDGHRASAAADRAAWMSGCAVFHLICGRKIRL